MKDGNELAVIAWRKTLNKEEAAGGAELLILISSSAVLPHSHRQKNSFPQSLSCLHLEANSLENL